MVPITLYNILQTAGDITPYKYSPCLKIKAAVKIPGAVVFQIQKIPIKPHKQLWVPR